MEISLTLTLPQPNQHLHSQIGFITPNQKHEGLDIELMDNRRQVYLAAKQKNPSTMEQRHSKLGITQRGTFKS
jgi:hypothetical protein